MPVERFEMSTPDASVEPVYVSQDTCLLRFELVELPFLHPQFSGVGRAATTTYYAEPGAEVELFPRGEVLSSAIVRLRLTLLLVRAGA